jgi:hypothetical protein
MWFKALHQKYEFGQWDAVPIGGDRVNLEIELRRSEFPKLGIPLRTYQLGMHAIEKILINLDHLGDKGVACGHH